MEEEEEELLVECVDCGAAILPERDRSYMFGEGGVLCFECALRRGGSYDGLHERWSTDPNVSDLAGSYTSGS